MAGGLRKLGGGRYGPEGVYGASGTLAGITGPGRRTVRQLELRRLGADEDLSVLAAFPDLESLELERIDGLDLSPLAGLKITGLTINTAADINLAPLALLPRLQGLVLLDLERVSTPPLRLAGTLQSLLVINDDPDLTGAPVKQVLNALDWDRLANLRSLIIGVGGLYEMRPVEVDLGFLRSLPNLERLDVIDGLRHCGSRSSPLEPPFDGLSRHLTMLRLDAWDPEPLCAALQAYLGIDPSDIGARPSVYQRYAYTEPAPPWSIWEHPDGDGWGVYGSLLRSEAGEHEDGTEYDACRRARRRIGQADPALLKRLDFDPESAGTGIAAATREDLEAALGILGLAAKLNKTG